MPGKNSTVVAAEQIRSWLGQVSPTIRLPILMVDSGYYAVPLSLALVDLRIGLLMRLQVSRYISTILGPDGLSSRGR